MADDDKNKLTETWKKWKENPEDSELRGELFNQAEPVISQAVNSFAGGKDDPVVEIKSRELAQKAFKTYDPEQADLKTHLYRQLQPLTRVVHKRANPLKIPQRAWWDLKNLREAEDEMSSKTGYTPPTSQLADQTGLSEKRIRMLRKLSNEGVPDSVLREKDPKAILSLEERDSDEDNIWVAEAVYHSLSPTDQKIMEYRTDLYETETLPNKDIAKKLGISASAVSQRASRIADMMKDVMSSETSPGGE